MPTYNALGISASLLVTNLDETLSDEIVLRMGATQQKDAKRIESALSKGRALVEQPLASNTSKVGVLQLVGEYEDMALFAVEAGGAQKGHDGDVEHDSAEQGRPLTKSDLGLMSMNDGTLPLFSPTQDALVRKSSKSSSTRKNTNDNSNSQPKAMSNGANLETSDKISGPKAELSGDQMRPESFAHDSTKQLALCLQVDCTKFYEHDNKELRLLGGKDIKFEVFINGHLVDVAFESSRPGKRNGIHQFHGTRIHRQSEKPWIYESSASESGSACDQRWANISQALLEEASTRGMNKQNQRPLTAEFLTSLARSQLPGSARAKGQRFAVVDLVITAGRGRKFGPETTYITEPSHLLNKKFNSVAPIVEAVDPHQDEEEDLTLQSDFFMANGEYIFNSDPDLFKGFEGMPAISTKQLHDTANLHTHTFMENVYDHSDTLDPIPTKIDTSSHEGLSGHLNGKRTLRQRFHDVAMASKTKREEAFESVKQEFDDGTANTFMSTLNTEPSVVATPEPKEARFFEQFTGLAFMDDNDEPDLNRFVTAPDALDRTLPQVNPFWLEDESFGPKSQFRATESTNIYYSGQDRLLEPGDPTQLILTSPKETSKEISKKTLKKTDASALSNSPISLPIKYNTSRRKRQAGTSTDENPVRSSKRAAPSPRTPPGSVDTPNRTSKRWNPEEQTPEQALGNFDIPDLCKGSAVTYADGLKQRQVSKARGGEFEEQDFVVGMRFIVL